LISELYPFHQVDLIEDDAVILDDFTVVYVWIGLSCSTTKKDMTQKTAQVRYLLRMVIIVLLILYCRSELHQQVHTWS
jgi:hypothetical protein